jgi:serine/threonine-protein kinase RsbW
LEGPVIKLRVPGQLRYRDVAVRTVAAVCKLVGSEALAAMGPQATIDPDGALDLSNEFDALMVSAFSEVYNDICLHGYAATHGAIDIEMQPSARDLSICITEHGAVFDVSKVKPPDLDGLPESGLGIFIVESCVDEFSYRPGPPNTWILRKRLDEQASLGRAARSQSGK